MGNEAITSFGEKNLSKSYLCIRGTSKPSGRLFFTAGNIGSKKEPAACYHANILTLQCKIPEERDLVSASMSMFYSVMQGHVHLFPAFIVIRKYER